MPSREFGLPIGVTGVRAVKEGTDYPIDASHIHSRAGSGGTVPVLMLNTGDRYSGEILEAQWRKGWDANISIFTASISGGTLNLTGVAAVAGTAGNGWINNVNPIVMVDAAEYTVSLESPVDDTGAAADRDIRISHFIKQDKDELSPDSDDNFVEIRVDVDESGLILQLYKEVNGVNTLLDSGYNYTMDGSRGTGNLEATIWRVVFNGKPGTAGATMSVYLKQAAT